MTYALQRQSIERWLSRRGLPQLVEGYGTERSIDVRTMRWVLLWAAVQVVALWATAPIGAEIRAGAAVASLAGLALYVFSYGRLTGRDVWRPRDRLTPYDVLATGLVPGVVAGIRFGTPSAALEGFLFHLQGVLLIYLFIGFGLLWILLWSVGWLASQLPHVIALAARTLPLVLILVIFLLFASELWQSAVYASGSELLVVVGIAALIAVGFLGTRVREDVHDLETSAPLPSDFEGTPAEPMAAGQMPDRYAPLGRLQRWNVGLVLLISQLLQAMLVGVIVICFLLIVGLLLAPAAVQELWTGGAVTELLAFDALGERRLLSNELLVVSCLLGTFAALYFAGFALDDDRYRAGAVARTLADLRRALAVRAAYAAMLKVDSAGEVGGQDRP